MKKAIFILCLNAMCISMFGQLRSEKFDVKWGQPIKINKRMLFEDIMTIDQDGNIHVLYKGFAGRNVSPAYNYQTARVSPALNYLSGRELKLLAKGQQADFYEVTETGGKVFVFSYLQDNKKKQKSIFIHTYNPSDQNVSQGEKIAEMNFEGFKKSRAGFFKVKQSMNKEFVVVFYSLPFDGDDPERFGAIVYDQNMKEVWKNEFTLPHRSDRFEMQEMKVGNNGEVFILGRKYQDKSSGQRKDPKNFHFVMLHSAQGGKSLMENQIGLKNYYITDMTAEMNTANDIVCAGFLSEKSKSNSMKGVFYIVLDQKSGQVKLETVSEFDLGFITEGMSPRQQEKAQKVAGKGKNIEMPYYVFRDFILKENGGALITAEEYYVVMVQTTSSSGVITTKYYYHFNEIIVVDLKSDGSINWTAMIPKKQATINDFGFYSSYLTATSKGKVYLLYNDHIDNLKNKTNTQRQTGTQGIKNNMAAMITIDNKGNWTKEMLFTISAAGINFLPKYSMQISEDEILLYCYRRGNNRFGIATIK
jgi:hypothetical protein